MKERNISVDILKFIAAVLIVNSHMGILYPNSNFATGGSIGNVLFFFVSGFTLFLKPLGRFDDFYKKRINRIYPTIFAWAILKTIFFESDSDIIQVILYGGGWFISCIMIHYIILYFINKTLSNHLYLVGFISLFVVFVWFYLRENPSTYSIYGTVTFFRWGYYFLFMLLGAIFGVHQNKIKHQFGKDLMMLFVCTFIFYAILYFSDEITFLKQIEVISLLPLLGITIYFYKIGGTEIMRTLYNNKFFGKVIKIIGGLCLEMYLVQFPLISNKIAIFFPLNIIIMFAIILIAAYILRLVSRVFSQIFKDQGFNWKTIFSLY